MTLPMVDVQIRYMDGYFLAYFVSASAQRFASGSAGPGWKGEPSMLRPECEAHFRRDLESSGMTIGRFVEMPVESYTSKNCPTIVIWDLTCWVGLRDIAARVQRMPIFAQVSLPVIMERLQFTDSAAFPEGPVIPANSVAIFFPGELMNALEFRRFFPGACPRHE